MQAHHGPQPGTGGEQATAEQPYGGRPSAGSTADGDATPLTDLTDQELTPLVRDGNERATAELYDRHRAAVLAHARACTRDPHTAEDITAEAFTRTLSALLAGAGPTGPWRPYLVTVVRHLVADWAAERRRAQPTDDVEHLTAALPTAASGEQTVLRRENDALIARTFHSLPERWQQVLWHTVVEGRDARHAGSALGLSASGVWSLAERAREGLREAYLTAHAGRPGRSPECDHHSAQLARAVRRSDRRSDRRTDRKSDRESERRTDRKPDRALANHLSGCAPCRLALEDIKDLNSRLRAALPLLLPLAPGSGAAALAWQAVPASVPTAAAPTAAAPAAGAPAAGLLGVPQWIAVTSAVVVAAGALTTAVYVQSHEDGGRAAARPSSTGTPSGTAAAAPDPVPSPTTAPPSTAPPSTAAPMTASPTTSTARPSSAVPPIDRTRLRIDSTGLCMDIDAAAEAQPHEAPCTGRPAQSWDLIPVPGRSRQIAVRNARSGLCLTHTGTTADGAPVRQAVCDGNALQVWTLNRTGDGRAGILTADGMHLGLKEWARADRQAHDPLIATSPFYYGSPSLRFRVD
ncbi:sigma-70 family RNA polymerase sigma factor [Kitasatospora purpeofusca]|uniref:sigma-70 family RNA polymerase sigma factor n=1 Tax=Kitasatospora purpeofusca TaxID=67352 RepID=UPI0036B5507A